MNCPVCNRKQLKVLDSRTKSNGIHRRRECQNCLTRFNTFEKVIIDSLPKYLRKRVLYRDKVTFETNVREANQ